MGQANGLVNIVVHNRHFQHIRAVEYLWTSCWRGIPGDAYIPAGTTGNIVVPVCTEGQVDLKFHHGSADHTTQTKIVFPSEVRSLEVEWDQGVRYIEATPVVP